MLISIKKITGLLFLSGFLALTVSALDQPLMQRKISENYGSLALDRFKQWQLLLSQLQNQSEKDKILLANQFFNSHIYFQEDVQVWDTLDYWATPLETLGRGSGDCEDYVIAKYFTLLEAGVAVEKLRFIYVKAQIGGADSRLFQAHMVLGYYETETSIPYILDNLVGSLELADQRTDLKPVFSFNSQGIWIGNQSLNVDPTTRLSRWRDLLQRAQADGF
jgi:predicted transglutaminase-like cysteine proteinase